MALVCSSSRPAATAEPGTDWTGRYRAGESAPPAMFMDYTIDVFRDREGVCRALVAADGYMTYRRLVARGEADGSVLRLRFVRFRSDDMLHASTGYQTDDELLVIERRDDGAFRLRFGPGGSSLNNGRTFDATRLPIPSWGGRYSFRHCEGEGSGATARCWSYAIEVSLGEEGWSGSIRTECPDRSETLTARGEEGEEASLGKYLALYRTSADGGSSTIDVELLRLVKSRDGSVQLVFRGLAGPPGFSEAEATIERPEGEQSRERGRPGFTSPPEVAECSSPLGPRWPASTRRDVPTMPLGCRASELL
ncbi:MAG: DUF5991 domain-containing protein [Acidobacteriota bacterium]